MMCKEVFYLSVPFQIKHLDAFWHFLSFYGHQLCSTYSRFIFILFERDFMSDLQKSKRFDLIDMFNDTSRYLDNIIT